MYPNVLTPADLTTLKPSSAMRPGIIVACADDMHQAIWAFRAIRTLREFAWDHHHDKPQRGDMGFVLDAAQVITNPFSDSMRYTLTVGSIIKLGRGYDKLGRVMLNTPEYAWQPTDLYAMVRLAHSLQVGMSRG
jgi:hypothetical protein